MAPEQAGGGPAGARPGWATRCATASSSSWSARSTAAPARVGEGLGRRETLGQFCLVALQVENTGAEGRTFGGGQQFLFDRAGNRHDPDPDATARHGGGRLLSTHLNPGQRLAGTLVDDVPDRVELARVELHDAPFSGGASVTLG